jgi:hypothetical protein
MMTLFELLQANGEDLTNHDVAVLSDWASTQVRNVPNPDWKRAYALIREGADLLLRRRARSSCELDQVAAVNEPEELNHERRDVAVDGQMRAYVDDVCVGVVKREEVANG